MFYFAYGSNLNHYQMKNIRCFGSRYLKPFFLKDYKSGVLQKNMKKY